MLQGAIIWTPLLAPDNLDAAKQNHNGFSDSRLRHFWDSDRILGGLISQTLNLKTAIAWDVYLIYAPDHPWHAELPPAPEFWMHQLDEEPTLFLDSLRLKRTVHTMIERSKFE